MTPSLALALAGTLMSAVAVAQEAPQPAPMQEAPTAAPTPAAHPELAPAEEVLARMPTELLGIRGIRPASSPMILFMGRNLGRDPIIGVLATRGSRISDVASLRENARGAFHETGLRRIFREGSFTTPHWPNANTFFGEYLAGSGFKQSWIAETGSEVIVVTATYFRERDRERVEAAVAEHVFGGAVITAAAASGERGR